MEAIAGAKRSSLVRRGTAWIRTSVFSSGWPPPAAGPVPVLETARSGPISTSRLPGLAVTSALCALVADRSNAALLLAWISAGCRLPTVAAVGTSIAEAKALGIGALARERATRAGSPGVIAGPSGKV